MSTNASNANSFKDDTKLGDYAAQQPLSGVGVVNQSGAVNGHGGFALVQTSEASPKDSAA
jgi:hypothetical protein